MVLARVESSFAGARPLLCMTLLVFLAACGKVGDPLPPIPRAPIVVSELAAIQQGTNIVLSFPVTRTPRSMPLGHIAIYRLVEPANAPMGLSPEEFSTRASLIAEVPGKTVPASRSTITYQDAIPLSPNQQAVRYRYSVRLVATNGLAADFSNYAILTPLTEIAKPGKSVTATVSQNEIALSWTAPAENETGTRPANVSGYNIYRTHDGTRTRLNSQLLKESQYLDRSFQFGTAYQYAVRALSQPAAGGDPIESNESEPLVLTPKDTFAPGAPDSIKIASINGTVSMFWPSNPAADLAGYYIYRSESANLEPARWTKLTPRVHTPTTYHDERVTVGKTYYYQISAVDLSGNESARSTIVSETVNP